MFSEVFMRLVQEKGITTYQVAKATGISQGLMGQYKKGDKIPTAQNLIKIADYFGVSTDYLLGKEDKKEPSSESERVTEEDIKVALFGGSGEVTDKMWEEAKNYVEYIKERERRKKGDV